MKENSDSSEMARNKWHIILKKTKAYFYKTNEPISKQVVQI